MAEGNSRQLWSHTSHILWVIAESNRDKRRRSASFKPSDFNPWFSGKSRRGEPLTVGRMLALSASMPQETVKGT